MKPNPKDSEALRRILVWRDRLRRRSGIEDLGQFVLPGIEVMANRHIFDVLKDSDRDVRYCVARNPKTPAKILTKLAEEREKRKENE